MTKEEEDVNKSFLLKIHSGSWRTETLERIVLKFKVKYGFKFHHSLGDHTYLISGNPGDVPQEEFQTSQHSLVTHKFQATDRTFKILQQGVLHDWQLLVFLAEGHREVEKQLKKKFKRLGVKLLNQGDDQPGGEYMLISSARRPGGEGGSAQDQQKIMKIKQLELNRTIEFFTSQPQVLFVDKVEKFTSKNKYAMQSVWLGGAETLQQLHPSTGSGNWENLLPSGLGSGQLITVMDTGLDYEHCFFQTNLSPGGGDIPLRYTWVEQTYKLTDRIPLQPPGGAKVRAYVQVRFSDGQQEFESDFQDEPQGHGTHVSGSAAGGVRAEWGTCQGAAKEEDRTNSEAGLLFIDVQNVQQEKEHLLVPPMLTPLMQLSYQAGSRIFTNSWGSNGPWYNYYCQEVDKFVWEHDDYVVLFAAGNEGEEGEHFSLSSPGVAKNIISVGATMNTRDAFLQTEPSFWRKGFYDLSEDHIRNNVDLYNQENLISFSSRGPTWDGRIGPLVVNVGAFVLSSRARDPRGHSALLWMPGTSMATPLTARAVSALVHRLQTFYEQPHPSSALIRALLMASAEDLRGGISGLYRPSKKEGVRARRVPGELGRMEQGFGRVYLQPFWRDEFRWVDRARIQSFKQPQARCFRSLRTQTTTISLAWTDPPGFVGEKGRMLVNDLDLRVMGWRKGGEMDRNQPDFIMMGNHGLAQDRLNNHERVRFEVLEGDLLRVLVSTSGPLQNPQLGGGHHPVDEQRYSLVWSSHLQEESCPQDCTLYDPEFECLPKGDDKRGILLGVRPCLEEFLHYSPEEECWPALERKGGKSTSLCEQPGTARKGGGGGGGKCTCYGNIPCASQEGEGLHGFALCQPGGEMTSCQLLDSIFLTERNAELQRDEFKSFRSEQQLVQANFIQDQEFTHETWEIILVLAVTLFLSLALQALVSSLVRSESRGMVIKKNN